MRAKKPFVFNGNILHLTDDGFVSRCGYVRVLGLGLTRRRALYAFIRGRPGRRYQKYHLCSRCFTAAQQEALIPEAIKVVNEADIARGIEEWRSFF